MKTLNKFSPPICMKYCNLRLKKYFFKIILIHCFCCFVVRNSSQLFAESQCLVTTTRQGGSEVFKPPKFKHFKKGSNFKNFRDDYHKSICRKCFWEVTRRGEGGVGWMNSRQNLWYHIRNWRRKHTFGYSIHLVL